MSRSLLAVLATAMALAALASPALGAEFKVEGKPLTGEEAFTGFQFEPTSPTGSWKLWLDYGGTIDMSCSNSTSSGSFGESGEISVSTESFSSCPITNHAECSLEGSSLSFNVQGSVSDEGTEHTLIYRGSGENKLAMRSLPLRCVGLAQNPVFGEWTCKVPDGGEEKVEHEIYCHASYSELQWGVPSAAQLRPSYNERIKLKSGKKWSIA